MLRLSLLLSLYIFIKPIFSNFQHAIKFDCLFMAIFQSFLTDLFIYFWQISSPEYFKRMLYINQKFVEVEVSQEV